MLLSILFGLIRKYLNIISCKIIFVHTMSKMFVVVVWLRVNNFSIFLLCYQLQLCKLVKIIVNWPICLILVPHEHKLIAIILFTISINSNRKKEVLTDNKLIILHYNGRASSINYQCAIQFHATAHQPILVAGVRSLLYNAEIAIGRCSMFVEHWPIRSGV